MPDRQLDTTYTYRGPQSGVTLKTEGAPNREVLFFDGLPVSVPADHPYIKRLVAQHYLTAIDTTAAEPAPSAPSPSTTRPVKPKSAQETR